MSKATSGSGWRPRYHPTLANICWVPQEAECSVHDNFCSGWYYVDETENLNGPFGDADAAKNALDIYTENFLK